MAFCAVAKEDAVASGKRLERQAERKRESDGGDILAESLPTTAATEASQSGMLESAFKRLWKANYKWAHHALEDAVAYASINGPRSTKTIEESDQVDEITTLFYGSLWPSLKGRGWKEEASESGKSFTYGHYRVR
jgi:hypothetical protein